MPQTGGITLGPRMRGPRSRGRGEVVGVNGVYPLGLGPLRRPHLLSSEDVCKRRLRLRDTQVGRHR